MNIYLNTGSDKRDFWAIDSVKKNFQPTRLERMKMIFILIMSNQDRIIYTKKNLFHFSKCTQFVSMVS